MLRRRAARRRVPGLAGRIAHAAEIADTATPALGGVSVRLDSHAHAPQEAQPAMQVTVIPPAQTAPVPEAGKP